MEAGRELDALVAEKVMGLEVDHWDTALVNNAPHIRDKFESWRWVPLPSYSTDIAAAWEVVEKLIDLYGTNEDIDIFHDSEGAWNVELLTGKPLGAVCVQADTAPLVICLAALKAVE